jgi:predicted phosphate transport protein (TIGR00153 family)
MFHWFQRLMPRQGDFFTQFETHATHLVAAGEALARLFDSPSAGRAALIQQIDAHEQQADDVTRAVLKDVRRTFLTPFDRSAIVGLIGELDDALDEMQLTAGAISIYEVDRFEPEMREIAGVITECTRIVAEALPLLRNIRPNAGRLNELTEQLVTLEGRADGMHAQGLHNLFRQLNKDQALDFVVHREIFRHLERVTDCFEDVANEIDGLVIDHA